MKGVLEFLAVGALLLAALEASGFALRDRSGVIESTKLEIENLLYDAIFNSSSLARYANHTLNATVDSQSQACLDTYTLRNVEILRAGGTKMRWCTFVSEMDLQEYFNTHDGLTFKLGIIEKIVGCTHGSYAFRMLDCYADTIAAGLSIVKNADLSYYNFYNYNWRQKRCLQNDLYRLVPKMFMESDRLKNCLQRLNETRPCTTAQPFTNSTTLNSAEVNVTNPWITQASNSTNSITNGTESSMTLSPWSNSTNSNTTPSPLLNSTNSNVNGTTGQRVRFSPWENSTYLNETNTPSWFNSTNYNTTKPSFTLPPWHNLTDLNPENPWINSNITNSRVTVSPYNNTSNPNNSSANRTNSWVTLTPPTSFNTTNQWLTPQPWINSTNTNSTLSSGNNTTYNQTTQSWMMPTTSNNSNNSNNSYINVTNSWMTPPPWNNFTNSNVINPWMTMPPLSNFNLTLPPWFNFTNSNANVTNPWWTLPPWNNLNNLNYSIPWLTHSSTLNLTDSNANSTAVLHSLNDTKPPIQNPLVQTTEPTTVPTTANNNNKQSWLSSVWHKFTNIFN